MIIEAVTVENIGLFRGTNEFSFGRGHETRLGKAVAVAGKNGVGKTTLFRAAPLALHGALSVGDRVSQRDYTVFLGDLLHRTVGPDGYRQRARQGRVTVKISYVRSGRAHSAVITRLFRADAGRVVEELFIESDELDHQVRDPQAWVNDLLPPSVASVWLFDAEDLGRLIGAEERAAHLKRTFQRLLGVHLVERLVADLQHFVLKSGAEEMEPLRVRLLEARAALEDAELQRTDIEAQLDEVREHREGATQVLRELEAELAAEGGVYARLRDRNAAEAAEVEKRITRLEERLRQECEGLLPIAASQRVYLSLCRHLESMESSREPGDSLRAWRDGVDMAFDDAEFVRILDQEVGVPRAQVHVVKAALSAAGQRALEVAASQVDRGIERVHDLSSSERRSIQSWLLASGDAYRNQLRDVAGDLVHQRRRLADLRAELLRAPDDESLAPLHARISETQIALDAIEERQRELLRRHGEVEKRRQDAERHFEQARKQFEAAQRHDQGVELAVRSRNASAVFQDALVRQKLGELEEGILSSFNVVCRKQHLLSGVRIDPKTFRTELQGYRGHKVVLEEFSAGERQLFNMAVFKAMRDVSRLDLPLFIDTPFARLDATHRHRLVAGFFQELANQVVLFMTDAEGQALEAGGEMLLEPKVYWLEADLARQATSVSIVGVDDLIARARETAAA